MSVVEKVLILGSMVSVTGVGLYYFVRNKALSSSDKSKIHTLSSLK